MAPFTKNADNTPETATMPLNSSYGRCAMPHHPGADQRERSRRAAGWLPQSSCRTAARWRRSRWAAYACWSVNALAASIRPAPTIATPVRSTRNQGKRVCGPG